MVYGGARTGRQKTLSQYGAVRTRERQNCSTSLSHHSWSCHAPSLLLDQKFPRTLMTNNHKLPNVLELVGRMSHLTVSVSALCQKKGWLMYNWIQNHCKPSFDIRCTYTSFQLTGPQSKRSPLQLNQFHFHKSLEFCTMFKKVLGRHSSDDSDGGHMADLHHIQCFTDGVCDEQHW